LTVSPEGLTVKPTPPPEKRGFLLSRRHRLDYAFEREVSKVIGVDVQLEFRTKRARPAQAGLALGGEAFSLELLCKDETNAIVTLAVGGDVTRIESESMPRSERIRLRLRWHTHGQMHMWINGELRRYKPDLAIGAELSVPSLSFTGPNGNLVGGWLARRIQVKLLRRDDAVNVLDRLLPIDPGLSRSCARLTAAMKRPALALIRQYMTATVTRLTREWRHGDPHLPFSAESLAAHEAAMAGAREFMTFLVSRDPAAGEQFLSHTGKFLAILAAADPDGYTELIAQLSQLPMDLDPECRAQLEPVAKANAETLAPVGDLLQTAWEMAQAAGGPDV